MKVFSDKSSCCGCGACAQICPKQCITMCADGEGFLYPETDEASCVHCGLCERACPVKQIEERLEGTPATYAAYNKNDVQRQQSSSGGIFSLLAEKVLKEGGVVFGAAMSDDCRSVQHIAVDRLDDLKQLRGSKYLQSEVGATFCRAKKLLDQGRKVLFSGTPCEIEGLKCFLRRDYENLLCVDVICHGVPSPKLWKKYVLFRENCAGAGARRTFFRHKKYGWKTYAVLFEFTNNTAYEQVLGKDLFLQMFLQDLCLRPSCYACSFKKKNRVSDITLADFWGCESVCPDLDDDKGLSLILIHSQKGQKFFSELENKMVCREMNFHQAVQGNPSLTESCTVPDQRKEFMEQMDVLTIPQLARKYLKKPSLKAQISALIPGSVKKKIKHFLNRC